MPDAKPAFFRQMKACLHAHLSAWIHSPRTILMGLFILCVTYMLTRSYEFTLQNYGYTAYLGESVFYHLNMGFSIPITSIMFLIMVSEIPKRISFQNFMLIRSSRGRWLTSQILFCVTVVLLMVLILMVFSTLLTIQYVSPGNGWSDLDRLAADEDYIYEPQLIPEYLHSISPLQASLYAAALLYFFWFTMVLVILLFSVFGYPNLGLMIYVFLIILHVTLLWEVIPGMKTPMDFATMGSVSAQYPGQELVATFKVLVVHLGIDTILIALMAHRIRHTDLCFSGKE